MTEHPPEPQDRTEIWDGAGATPPLGPPGRTVRGGRLGSRLPPGFVLLGRYRIVESLGAGTMGEVYRAEDLRLGQDVALKFLARIGGSDEDHARAALLNEIKLARRVSHPHVCRVHDIGEADGRPFVSMEYVRGEDLGRLLRRIGRMHGERALRMARQICAGVQAMHEQGVLHRDLKPANILVDQEGDVRITDFGIAAAGDGGDDGDVAGSPAYMAPELFTGGRPGTASDLFALGLVLFELFTGRRLFQADSMTTLLELHRKPVQPPSQVVPAVDRQIDGVVVACLQRDPNRRPPSALAVLAELPGGDPLAEALAAGQTPSPALVAAASGASRLSLRRAALLAGLALLAFALAAALDPTIKLVSRAPLPLSGDVLGHRALECVRALGCDVELAATAQGFEMHGDVLDALEAQELDAATWNRALAEGEPAVTFWFRGAARASDLETRNVKGRVHWNDPPQAAPGMVRVRLDTRGRLLQYAHVPLASGGAAPPPGQAGRGRAPPTDAELFALAGLAPARFEAVPPVLVPESFADERAAWLASSPAPGEDARERIEVARLAGHPVAFTRLLGNAPPVLVAAKPPSVLFFARVVLLLVAAGLAWHALWRRHADLTGALRIGAAIFVLVALFTVLTGDHGGGWGGVGDLALQGMSHGLAVAAELAVYYFALEPHARRVWPKTMVSWSRLLSGRWRDPQVAASALVGAFVGCVAALIHYGRAVAERTFGAAEPRPVVGADRSFEVLDGTGPAIGVFCEIVVDVTRESLMIFVALVVLRLLLRREWLAGIAAVLVWTVVWGRASSGGPAMWALSLVSTFISSSLVIAASIRFGLLSLVVGYVVFALMFSFPIRPDVSVWYSTVTLLPSLAMLLLFGGCLMVLSERVRWRAAT